MPRDPLSRVTATITPQSQPVPGRTDMVLNAAGGYVFEKDDEAKLRDFLILGTTGGGYYLGEDRLTTANAGLIMRLARENGAAVVRAAEDVSASRPPKAPSNRPALFALAAVSALGNPEAVQLVKTALPKIARTTDHLSAFFGYRKQLKGKPQPGRKTLAPTCNRALQGALSNWFLTAPVNDVAWRACKARQRKTPAGENFSLRDALRIAHPKTTEPDRRALFGWLAGHVTDAKAAELLPAVHAFVTAQAVTSPAEAIRVITEHGVPWEFLPSSVLNDAGVWEALISTVGLTALIRNLARVTRLGTLAPFASANKVAVARLVNADALAKARIHPAAVYMALRVYASGSSQPDRRKPPARWVPVPEITDALDEAWELSFGHCEPSGKKLLVSVDSSGSMSWASVTADGSDLGPAYVVGCTMAAIIKRIEGANAHVIDVDTDVRASKITRRTQLAEISRWPTPGGGTDLALPFRYALRDQLEVDGFVMLSDMMTWYGDCHPFQALTHYRQVVNPQARSVGVTMTPHGQSVIEPGDPGSLNAAGMDASLPQIITGFIR